MLNNTANKYLNFAITSIYPINAAISYSPSRPEYYACTRWARLCLCSCKL